jgi:DNA-binding transcriptional MerR regulator
MSPRMPGRVSDTGVMTTDAARPGVSSASDGLTVGRTANLVGVSIRTLHHWDTIGLVRPSGRTWAGYRVYSDLDVARIHRVLVYRELGFELAQIGRILDDPTTDADDHLRRQRDELVERIDRLQRMVGAVDRMLEASRTGIQLSPQQQVEIFGHDWRPEWVDEAEQRWGQTAQWAQYSQRAAALSPTDWEKVTAETDAVNADLAAAKRSGVAPGSAKANALAERHRALMSTYFDCTHAMQVCMGRMFVEDPGFAAHYDKLATGLAQWLQEVLFANAAAHGVDPESATWE